MRVVHTSMIILMKWRNNNNPLLYRGWGSDIGIEWTTRGRNGNETLASQGRHFNHKHSAWDEICKTERKCTMNKLAHKMWVNGKNARQGSGDKTELIHAYIASRPINPHTSSAVFFYVNIKWRYTWWLYVQWNDWLGMIIKWRQLKLSGISTLMGEFGAEKEN